MFAIDLTLSVLSLFLIIISAFLIGYAYKSRQLKKKQIKISELRREMINNHAYILELQKEFLTLEQQLKFTKTPVLPIKVNIKDYPEENQRLSGNAR